MFAQPCHCRPILSYLFPDEPESPSDIIEPIPDEVPAAEAPVQADAIAPARPLRVLSLEPTEMEPPSRPPLGNGSLPWSLNPVALAARLLNRGVRGTKRLVEGGTSLTARAVGGVSQLGAGVIDGVQNAIDRGADSTLSRVSGWVDATDKYRKGLSGVTAKAPDQGHSITISTDSGTPLQTFNDFVNSYLSPGTASDSMPGITGIDLSKLW